MKESILCARDLCKSFVSNGVQNHVIFNLNLDIYKNDFTVIMGSSGSGKSTLLYSLSGMDSVTLGKVLYKGEDITKFNEKRMSAFRNTDIGFIFQQMHLVSNLSLFENVAVPGYMCKKQSAAEINKRALKLLQAFDVEAAKDRLPSQVSGGEAQRAAIARAIINKPSILFADEPTGALNRKNTNGVLDLLTELNKQGQSIVMVTHDIHAALRATRLIYLEDGAIKGEIELPPFSMDQLKSRETQVNAWLSSMDW